MAYYGRRRYNPAADERREREERQRASVERSRAKFKRLMRQFRKIALRGDEAQAAWREPQRRSYTLAIRANGDHVQVVVRGKGRDLFLQEPSGMGWGFYRLVPKHHVFRAGESSSYEDDRDRSRRR